MGRAREYAGVRDVAILELDSMEKYALVACGDADVYMRLPRSGSSYAHKIWDHAAGVALVQAAGGLATDLDGGPLDFSRGESMPNAGMIISNGQQHARLVEAVGRVMSEQYAAAGWHWLAKRVRLQRMLPGGFGGRIRATPQAPVVALPR